MREFMVMTVSKVCWEFDFVNVTFSYVDSTNRCMKKGNKIRMCKYFVNFASIKSYKKKHKKNIKFEKYVDGFFK